MGGLVDTTSIAPLTLRWRIHEGQLPLRQRHLRSLEPLNLPEPLMGWIHERLEWAALNMLGSDTEGVLVLNIDPAQEVTVLLDAVREAPALSREDLLVEDGLIVGAQSGGETLEGTVWLERVDGTLQASGERLYTATATLASDLCTTLKLPLEVKPQSLEAFDSAAAAFLISNEFGFIAIKDNPSKPAPATEKLKECFSKLW
ncbi:MAG: hypothetical protein FWF91_04435 [Coriobacteriia bacterium]|nr:hypothetical protein [Coriobacteriia bacterium]